jgi:CBS domain-containing protein
MAEIDAGALPVGEDERLVGMITDRDIAVCAVAREMPASTKVREIMSEEGLYCPAAPIPGAGARRRRTPGPSRLA